MRSKIVCYQINQLITILLYPSSSTDKVNNNQEDTFEFIKEGFMTAFAAFMVSDLILNFKV